MLTKTCRKCEQDHPADLKHFYKNSRGKYGLTPRCKACVNEDNAVSHAKRMATDPERIRALANERSKKSYYRHLDKNRARQRDHQAKRRSDPHEAAKIRARKRAGGSGLTPEEIENIFQSQGCVCAICRSKEPGSKIGWNLDHCHKTGRIRFILCAHCNRGLGAFRDNPNFMRKAADMLDQFMNQEDRPVGAIHE